MKIYEATLERFRQVSDAYYQAAIDFRANGNVKALLAAKHWLDTAQTETDKVMAS